MNFYDVLAERGLIAQATDADPRARFAQPVAAYIGFDPTADSLHVGSLVPIVALRWLQVCGHRAVALIGGATGLVGDPSGKSSQRQMLSREQVAANARAIASQLQRLLSEGPLTVVDNAAWLGPLGWIEMLREAGPHFSVNRMLTMDSVRARLEGGGLSFLEFNYMVMQAWDFWHLARTAGVSVQLGGQDQWGNIVMGIELARRKDGLELAGLTLPLITRADGGKFGKSEAGTVWLAAERTSPYEFYQFWRNTADADVARYLAYFTMLPLAEIRALTAEGGAALNAAKERLAWEVTRWVHGEAAAQQARDSARRAFGADHDAGGAAIPHALLEERELAAGIPLADLLVRAGLAPSKSEARRLISGGGVCLHDARIEDPQRLVTAADARERRLVLRVGKKRWFRFDIPAEGAAGG
ncbi:MAG: tyrosine--tRNA ligase [Planctomycetota bacterium]|nr:tyrosine--tRNA ligase [Planctomycetota bacterium]